MPDFGVRALPAPSRQLLPPPVVMAKTHLQYGRKFRICRDPAQRPKTSEIKHFWALGAPDWPPVAHWAGGLRLGPIIAFSERYSAKKSCCTHDQATILGQLYWAPTARAQSQPCVSELNRTFRDPKATDPRATSTPPCKARLTLQTFRPASSICRSVTDSALPCSGPRSPTWY